LNLTTEAYSLWGLSYPIAVHCYGFNSFTLKSKSELVEKIVLPRLSDSLSSVNVISNRISAEESLKRILKNTTALHTPPDTLFQDFTYMLLSAAKDTLAFATGLVSRGVRASWNEKVEVYIDSIRDFYLDSNRADLLREMWPTPFVSTRKTPYVNFLNESRKSHRQEIKISLDSIVKHEDVFKYYFHGTSTYKALLRAPHATELWFSGKGLSLEDAILDKAASEQPFDFVGNKSFNSYRYTFDDSLSYFGFMLHEIAYTAEDKKCPNCIERLILSNARTDLTINKKRFRMGYSNFWQFKYATTRDSIMPYLLVK
jgi:hypothetical protein